MHPDFLATGNFTANGYTDLLVASRSGSSLYVFSSNRKGDFTQTAVINVQGTITALAASGLWPNTTVAVGVAGPDNSFSLTVFRKSEQGLAQSSSYALSGAVTAIAFGRGLPGGADAAIVAGGQVQMLHESNRQLETLSLSVSAVGVAIGSFVQDGAVGQQLALLGSDGSIHIATHGATWKVVESFSSVAPISDSTVPVIIGARTSGNASDDVMVLSPNVGRMSVVSHPSLAASATAFAPGQLSTGADAGAPVAALAMRVNTSPRPGLVVLHQGQVAPEVLAPLGDPTFNVNTTTDGTSANACANAVANQCSLREAIAEADATAAVYVINVPAGTYQLASQIAIAPLANTMISIVGAGSTTTFVQNGTTNSNGNDRVFEINPLASPQAGLVINLSGLTIRFGKRGHVNGFGNNNLGGGVFWSGASDGSGQLTITSCTITDNSTVQDAGGGLWIRDSNNFATGTIKGSNVVAGVVPEQVPALPLVLMVPAGVFR